MMKNRQSAFCNAFLENLYIPVAFSQHGALSSSLELDESKGFFNIIYIRKDIIEERLDQPDYIKNLQPVNQSTRFIINDIPDGMILETNQKSFAVTNFILNKSTGQGVSVVSTELVGSRAEDMFFAVKIRDYEYLDLNNQKARGLRGAQLTTIFKTVKNYNGNYPDIICGDLGGAPLKRLTESISSSTLTYQDAIWIYFKKNYSDLIPYFITDKTTLTGNINDYLSNGMDSVLGVNGYLFHTIRTPTKLSPPIQSNYIITRSSLLPDNNKVGIKQQDVNNFMSSPTSIKYGSTIPVHQNFNISNGMTSLKPIGDIIQQGRVNASNAIKLFKESELQDILASIDQLMSVFAYGRQPYLRRDLGCFCLRDTGLFSNRVIPDFYNKKGLSSKPTLLKESLKRVKLKNIGIVENMPENADAIRMLKDYYCLDFPSFVEVHLFQKSGFFSTADKTKETYYSVNQTTTTSGIISQTNFKFPDRLEILSESMPPKGTLFNPDIAMRLFMIPATHLKLVMGVDILEKSAADLAGITKVALRNFYGTYAVQRLESRLSEILYSRTRSLGIEGRIDNNLLAHLMEKTAEGHLKNIADGDAILDLFEMIFIFLRLKFIDNQMSIYNIKIQEEQKPGIVIEKDAKKSGILKTDAMELFDRVIELIAQNPEPLRQILYNTMIKRKDDNGKYLKVPDVLKDPKSLNQMVKQFKYDVINPRSYVELEKQKLLGLQFMESFLANALGYMLDSISDLLRKQDIHNTEIQTLKPFPDNLAFLFNTNNKQTGGAGTITSVVNAFEDYKIDKIPDMIARLYRANLTAGLVDIKVAEDVYQRCKILLDNIKQVIKMQEYFNSVNNFLGLYGGILNYLIIYEKNNEKDTAKELILEDVKITMNLAKVQFDKIKKEPYKLTTDMEAIYNQMEQMTARMQSDLLTDVQGTKLNPLTKKMVSYPIGQNSINPDYIPSIFDMSIRSAYFIYNRISALIRLKPASTTSIQDDVVNYKEIKTLCDLVEIGYDYLRELKDSSSHTSHSPQDEIILKNYSILASISRFIWVASDILEKGVDSYTLLKESTLGRTTAQQVYIELSTLFKEVINDLETFNNSINKKHSELCAYIMRPINLLTDFAYHMVNCFSYVETTKKDFIQPIMEELQPPPNTSLFNLYSDIKNFAKKANEYNSINTLRENKLISEHIIKHSNNQSNLTNIFGTYVGISNLGDKIEEHMKLEEVHDFIQSNIKDGDEVMTYNEYRMKTMYDMAELDITISEQIRNFQANDKCDNKTNPTMLQYEPKYKPTIFNLSMGNMTEPAPAPLAPLPPHVLENETIDKLDNGMVYCFLDVLDYYKNKINDNTFYNPIYENIIQNINTNITNNTPTPFSSSFEKMRTDTQQQNINNYNNFINSLSTGINTIINNNTLSNNLKEYIIKGIDNNPAHSLSSNNNLPFVRDFTITINPAGVQYDFRKNSYNNFIFILHNLLYLKRFTLTKQSNTILNKGVNYNDNGFISLLFNDAINPADDTRLTDGKKFCINYFLGNEINYYENMFIDLKYMRAYFLNVLYLNEYLVYDNTGGITQLKLLTKEDRIKLILYSAFSLSFLLNHNGTKPSQAEKERITKFAFIILGICVFDYLLYYQ